MRRAAILTLLVSASCAMLAMGGAVELYPSGDFSVGLFSNQTDKTATMMTLTFTEPVEILSAFGVGGHMVPTSDPSSYLVRFEGTLLPTGTLIVHWRSDTAKLLRVALFAKETSISSIHLLSPFARFSIRGGVMGLSTTFDASCSFDPLGALIVSYAWEWSDGVAMDGCFVRRVFDEIGEYEATLTVMNEDGRVGTLTKAFAISMRDGGGVSEPEDPEEPEGNPAPQAGEVIVYQVVANASGSPEIPNEMIRLKNVSDHTIDIQGCEISDEVDHWWAIPNSLEASALAPGETWTTTGSEYNPTNSTSGISLRNTGEEVFLRHGVTAIDSWIYPSGSSDDEVLTRP